MKKIFTYLFIIFLSVGVIFPQNGKIDDSCPVGMISYWKLDEFGSVNIFRDSFNNNNASTTDTNRPVQDSGIVNKARKFNSNSGLIVPENNLFDWSKHESFTIELWVKIPQPLKYTHVFIGKTINTSKAVWYVGCKDDKTIFSVSDSIGIETDLEGTMNISDGKWHHITAIRNDSLEVLKIYVDGKNDAIQSTFYISDFKNKGPITIGYFNNGFHFEGSIDEIAIYGRALNENEIKQHYNNGFLGKGYCDSSPTSVKNNILFPNIYILNQNYPNPFNPSTTIEFGLPESMNINLTIYNILGERVMILAAGFFNAGYHTVKFNAGNLTSGIYIYKLQTPNFIKAKKMLILK